MIRTWPGKAAAVVFAAAAVSVQGAYANADDETASYPEYLTAKSLDAISDPAGFPNRECESFVAWKTGWRTRFGEWGWAPKWGAMTDVSSMPTVGSVAWYNDRPGGHVAWVVAVNTDGGAVIEEMNRDLDGKFLVETISPGHNWPTGFLRAPATDTTVR
jgi:surface antigen